MKSKSIGQKWFVRIYGTSIRRVVIEDITVKTIVLGDLDNTDIFGDPKTMDRVLISEITFIEQYPTGE